MDLAGVLLIGLVSALSIAALSGTGLPSQAQTLIDRLGVHYSDPYVFAAWLIAIAGAMLVFKSLLSAILSRSTLRFLANRQAELSARLTAAFLGRPLLELQEKTSQDVAFGLTVGVQAATVGILGSASTAIADLGLLAILATGLTAVDPWVTLYAALFFGVLALALQKSLAGWASRMGVESTQVNIESYSAIQEALTSYREITVANRRDLYVSRIQALRWRSAEIGADSQFVGLIPKYVFESALVLGALALAVSQFLTTNVAAAVGIVSIFLVAGSRIMPALMRLQVTSLTIRQSEAPAERATSLASELDVETKVARAMKVPPAHSGAVHDFPDFDPHVDVRDLWLTYRGAPEPAIAGVSFRVGAGESVAFVGSTGAGKSTLADLLLGIIEPDRGEVLIGGTSPGSAIRKWSGGIAYVPQEVALVNGTVRQNVALGLPPESVEDELAWEALERAHLADFLRQSRDGLDTSIGESGMRLSGGQRQRLGIARALYTRPRLLVLDEATSALDAETEEAISQTMRDLEGSVTTITIAHRLATVRHCDLVIFLDHGCMAAQGTFDEVRALAPTFDHHARLLGL